VKYLTIILDQQYFFPFYGYYAIQIKAPVRFFPSSSLNRTQHSVHRYVHEDKDNFVHILYTRTGRSAAVSEHRYRNLAITSPIRYRYTNFVCSTIFLN